MLAQVELRSLPQRLQGVFEALNGGIPHHCIGALAKRQLHQGSKGLAGCCQPLR